MKRRFQLKINDLSNRYLIQGKIGQGGFGTVYEASVLDDKGVKIEGLSVAFKQQDISKLASNDADEFTQKILRMIREITTFELKHPNIVEVIDAHITVEKKFVIVSELAQNNLQKYVKEQPQKLSVSKISFIILQLLEALEYIHSLDIIHRDISPDNILVFKDNTVKICDFGVVSYGQQTYQGAGKKGYQAPESMLNQRQTSKSDIWSLGIVLYYLVTGEDNINNQSVNSLLSVPDEQQKLKLPDRYSQFQQIFNQMTAYYPVKRPSIKFLKEKFVQLIDNPLIYKAYQEELLAFRIKQFSEAQKLEVDSFSQFILSQLLQKEDMISNDVIQDNLEELLLSIKSYKSLVKSHLKDKQAEKLKFQGKIGEILIPYVEKQFNSNELIKVVPEIKPLTNEELIQRQKEFRRLVDKYVKKVDGMNDLLFQLDGECKLLYKASEDGFKAEDFHQKCDNKGPTVAFVLSEFGQVFGGYTSQEWKTPESFFQQNADEKAFIFSLTKNTKHDQYQNNEYAVQHFRNQLINFGMTEIQIKDSCNDRRTSQSNIGSTYLPPKEIKYGDQKAEEYLAGQEKFIVLEIEVYSVKAG
ncbi:tldc domain-containing protein [Stylonychia lemnae]|uniref:Tldc domain-containing protein n=1 Tax=Stylonychia lemnae TaxID=5949 RepID=A0A078AAW0_STYLE|nr:tldc domain-containing protein [Stylonychia lemnae]|eukprot:CDW79390.1 tldc domain-containing protein [Stylonychia lemnae]